MTDVVIENPILNSPYDEPSRHFRFSDEGITNEVVEGRRRSGYFVPVPSARTRQPQLQFETQWTQDRYQPNDEINEIRDYVGRWRAAGYPGVTTTTRELLEYWNDPDRSRPLFFAQREAAETAIFLTEIGSKEFGGTFLQNQLREWAEEYNPGLVRAAFKMATGSGKTTVMGMLIAWHTLNKAASPRDRRFADSFLVVAPGITIKDRLRVLLPTDPDTVYRDRDLIPPDRMQALQRARLVVTNYHAFLPRVTEQIKPLAREILGYGRDNPFVESPAQVVRRVLRDLGSRTSDLVVINDEAHHCYEPREAAARPKMSAEERSEATARDKEARVWLSGLRSVAEHRGVKLVYDLSATPFFLKGSGYDEGRLFPWVVSDFGLIDAIEAGLVKVPRVPVSDDAMQPEGPTYRELWSRIRDGLPKKGREVSDPSTPWDLPAELEGALHSLYANYERAFQKWDSDKVAQAAGMTPPVFIVVCNNTAVSKLVYDYIAGHEKALPDGETVWAKGRLPLFSNVRDDGSLAGRFNTILVDSQQLESGEGLSKDFRDLAAGEIEEFRHELRQRFPGRSVDQIEDDTLLREVMNTVGKSGRLGEHVRCVVSVSMLTEGWDANTVTHILGVRAFGTQLLCEQVVGRGLRRRSYALNEDGRFDPEYAEVYGVPFSFLPSSGSSPNPPPPKAFTRVRALEERAGLAITFPCVVGYRTELGTDQLTATFTDESRMVLTKSEVPTRTDMAGVAGAEEVHASPLDQRRIPEVEFELARRVVARLSNGGHPQPWLFPQTLRIVREWLADHVEVKDDAFPQLLLLAELAQQAAERIERAIHRSASAHARVLPVLRSYEPVGSTAVVDFDTTKPTFRTREDKSHVSHIVADNSSWEHKVAYALEAMGEVVSYVKNDHLGFAIPYTNEGQARSYLPDFLVRVDDRDDPDDLLTLIVEVSATSGHGADEKRVKVATATDQWMPAVNAHGGFGRWMFVEISDPETAKQAVREAVAVTYAGVE